MDRLRNPLATLGLFAKHPDHVAVKTRLAHTIGSIAGGADSARQVARLMTKFLLERLADSAVNREIVCWPPESAVQFQAEAGTAWGVVPQSDGDLGDRMSSWFLSALDSPNRYAIAIGADCPFVHPRHIDQTVELLQQGNDLVLGPAADGGYWLVGLGRKPEAIFSNIQWGTGHVLEATMRNANAAGWKTATLETLRDVDELDDLAFAVDQLLQSSEPDSVQLARQLSQFVQVKKT